ncbi:MAG: hypothetical protein KAG92_01530, partial [Deltaproteobacteria bacterium]|nr:hypothetical protein [Deltaproteobacteria bacterium]
MANSLFGRRYWGLLLLLAFLWYPVNGFSALHNGREREIRRIGVIVFAAPFLKSYEGLRSGLQDKGYKLDAELVFSVHSIEREVSKVAPLIEKFAADDFDLIYTVTTSVTQAVKLYIQENQIDIPTVFTVVADPVGSEIVTSLRHPGANITGISHVSKELLPQRLLRFKKAFPAIKRMALLFNPEDEVSKSSLNQPGLRLVAKDLEVDMVVKRVRNSDEVQSLCGGLAATDIDS